MDKKIRQQIQRVREWESFLNTKQPKSYDFQQEQQEEPCKSLDEAYLEKEIKDTCREYRINDSHEQELGKQDIENIARHFYELGKNSK